MKTKSCKRRISMLLAVMTFFSAWFGTGTVTAFAEAVEKEVYITTFPRDGDEAYHEEWGHDSQTYMNGWTSASGVGNNVRALDSYTGPIAYCIEPGVTQEPGDLLTEKGENFWINYPSEYNSTIEPDEIKTFIGRIMQYGYSGNVSQLWMSQNEGADTLAHVIAAQLLIWETVVGERDSDFIHVDTGGYDAILDLISKNHPLYSKIMSYYDSMESSVQMHSKLPSFFEKTPGKAQEIELEWDGSEYTAVLTDTNGVVGEYEYSADESEISFSVSGNKLTIIASEAPVDTVVITAAKKNSQRTGVITWTDGRIGPDGGIQDVVSYGETLSDPVTGFLKIKVSYGSVNIVKTSEDDIIEGISFTLSGNGDTQTVKTDKNGEVQIDNLAPGNYTVTEQTDNHYETQSIQKVTVISRQTSTVTFNNVLKRGDLSVTKTSEDGLVEGVKFHLYGTSLSGIKVDEYAITDSSGVAVFENVLAGTGYVLEELDTPDCYVVPESQTVAIEWNSVTDKDFHNALKKWNAVVTKSDSETGTAQGDASLSGAVYGVYRGEQLVDTYVTDENGQFTTSYYVCGDDWSIREISPGEGYLLNSESYHVGAEAKLYEKEFNSTSVDVLENIIKGTIAITKHSSDGSTQIETPEEGAEFAIYLKTSGTYDNAEETERDYLVCDENGFAETKALPYGVYTVQQTKGWEGRELMPAFDVAVSEDGEVYRYLINNSVFESYIKVVKTDSETGKTIASAGSAFQIYNPKGELVTMTYTYPEVTVIDTFYTTADGMLITPQALEYGTGYSLVEVSAPYGYVLDSTPIYFDITAENAEKENAVTIVIVERPNTPQKGTVTVEKFGEVFSSVEEVDGLWQPVYSTSGLEGAEYNITAVEDVYTPDGTLRYKAGEVVGTLVTGTDGTATSIPLYLGKYEVEEIKAPYGMVISSESKTVELTYAGQEVEITETSTQMYNERQRASINLSKVMVEDDIFKIGDNGEILSVQFGLFAADELTAADGSVIPKDGLLETVTCNKNGKAEFKTDIPVGAKLYVKEVATDTHYILDDTQYPVEFVYGGQETADVSIDVNNGEAIVNEIIYGSINGLKICREDESPIEGAVFGLFSTDTEEFTQEQAVLTAVSDGNGVFTFNNIPYGTWIIKEIAPAEGYLQNEELYTVQVTENEQLVEITVVNDLIPEIGTQARVAGEKEIYGTEIIILEDKVEYKHLIPGVEYVLKGVLMDKATGEPLLLNGEEIHSEVSFTPEEPTGEVTVVFTFDAKLIKVDTDIVVFERLYRDEVELAVHTEINDESQTVTVKVPIIGTQASIGGKKEVKSDEIIIIEDVVSYKNLTPGVEYVLEGVLMDKKTGKPLLVDGNEIRTSMVFKPETPDGKVIVEFAVDASKITGKTDIVVFEALYRDDVEIAVHEDIEDEGQTVTVSLPETDVPKTGDYSNLSLWIGLGAVAFGGMVAAGIMAVRHRKEDDSE